MCLLQMGAVLNRAAQKLEKKRKKKFEKFKSQEHNFYSFFSTQSTHINQRDNSVTELWHLIRWTPTEKGKMEWLLLKEWTEVKSWNGKRIW